jgi:hypothetical protein
VVAASLDLISMRDYHAQHRRLWPGCYCCKLSPHHHQQSQMQQHVVWCLCWFESAALSAAAPLFWSQLSGVHGGGCIM